MSSQQFQNFAQSDIYSIPDPETVLSQQPIVPTTRIEDVNFPIDLDFSYLPWHIHNVEKWKRIVSQCIIPLQDTEALKNAFETIHSTMGLKLFSSLEAYINSLTTTTVLHNGYTEQQTFFQIIIPMIQLAILNLPYVISQTCNWYDHSVLPIVSSCKLIPRDSKTLPQHDCAVLEPTGFSLDEFVEEIKRTITNGDKCPKKQTSAQHAQSSTTSTTTAPDADETSAPTGFFFGPGLAKLILPRKAVLGLMAVGFFGLFDKDQIVDPRTPITTTYPTPYENVTARYMPKWKSLQSGCVSEMYPYLERNRPGAVHAKLQAMLSYFAFFAHNISSPITQDIVQNVQLGTNSTSTLQFQDLSPLDHQHIIKHAYEHNCIGIVEYSWKVPAVQVDFALDTIFNRVPLPPTPFPPSTDLSAHPAEQQHNLVNSENTSTLLPLDLLPVGSRRQLYIPHPRLLTVVEFSSVFDTLIRENPQTSESDLQLAYNYIYAPERYPIEFPEAIPNRTDVDALINLDFSRQNPTTWQSNPFRRWLYGDAALNVLWLIMMVSKVKLGMTFIGGTAKSVEKGITYTNSSAMYVKLLQEVNQVLKAGATTTGTGGDELSQEYHDLYQSLLDGVEVEGALAINNNDQSPSATNGIVAPEDDEVETGLFCWKSKRRSSQPQSQPAPSSQANHPEGGDKSLLKFDAETLRALQSTLELIVSNLTSPISGAQTQENANSPLFFTPNSQMDSFDHLQNDATYASTHPRDHQSTTDPDANTIGNYASTQSTSAPPRFRIQTISADSTDHCIQGDFANKYPGGGTLHSGAVQEEMIFSENFECCALMMFSPPMDSKATIAITGIINHAVLGGYAQRSTLAEYYSIDHHLWSDVSNLTQVKPTPSPLNGFSSKFHTSAMLVYDSTPYGSETQQYQINEVKRQLGKLFSGLTHTTTYPLSISAKLSPTPHTVTISSPSLLYPIEIGTKDTRRTTLISSSLHNHNLTSPKTFVTGNWGCGVFNATGSWILTLQLIACAAMDVHLRYLNVGDERLTGGHSVAKQLFVELAQQHNVRFNGQTGPSGYAVGFTTQLLLKRMVQHLDLGPAVEKMEFQTNALTLLNGTSISSKQGQQINQLISICLKRLNGPRMLVQQPDKKIIQQWHRHFQSLYGPSEFRPAGQQ